MHFLKCEIPLEFYFVVCVSLQNCLDTNTLLFLTFNFTFVVFVGSREAAFTHSIVAAGTMHALSRACMETKIPSHCQCSREPRPRNLKRPDIWGGCGDNLPYGYEFSKKFVDAKETLTNSQNMNKIGRVLMNLHNNEAGRLVSSFL